MHMDDLRAQGIVDSNNVLLMAQVSHLSNGEAFLTSIQNAAGTSQINGNGAQDDIPGGAITSPEPEKLK